MKFKLFKWDIYGLALVDTGNLVKGTLVSSEFWKMIGGKMLEESNASVHTAEKSGKGLRVLGKGERIKGRRVDKETKKYAQVLPAVWKAERREPEVNNISTVEEVVERKLWAAEKVNIPVGSAKLVKVRTEDNWKYAGVVESLPLEDQEKGRKVLHPENVYDLSGSVQAVYVENHADECVELCVGQKLGSIHSMCIDKEAWIKEELRGSVVSDLDEEEVCTSQESVNSLQESDFPTEESRRKFIKESFKMDENEILNRDAKRK